MGPCRDGLKDAVVLSWANKAHTTAVENQINLNSLIFHSRAQGCHLGKPRTERFTEKTF
jgi:hypothetical protein